jgi:DNA-binding YbaB/EbfC family protein
MFEKAKDMYKLQKQARKIKKELKNTHIEAEHEGVTVTINGEQEIVKVEITDDAITNKSKLEDSLLKAINKGVKKSQQIGAEMMKDVMGDLNLPGMG